MPPKPSSRNLYPEELEGYARRYLQYTGRRIPAQAETLAHFFHYNFCFQL
jgi:hypothetical protein